MTVELTKDYATAERDLREHSYCPPNRCSWRHS
jgi:hypothetical protein